MRIGTFWYHSHLSTQYCDGLRGAFVVYDPQDPYLSLYDVDDGEHVPAAHYVELALMPSYTIIRDTFALVTEFPTWPTGKLSLFNLYLILI